MKQTIIVALVVGALAGPSLKADDGRERLGIQADYSIGVATDNVPTTNGSPAYNPQGSQDVNLFGLGVFYEYRIGSASTYELQRLAVLPSLSVRFGSRTDSLGYPSVGTVTGGQPVSLTGATASRKTAYTNTTLSLPFRYYLGEGGTRGEGVYLEAGPQVVHTQQTVNLATVGTNNGQGLEVDSSASYTKYRPGWTAGFGGTLALGETAHLALGLTLSQVAPWGELPTKTLLGYMQIGF